MHAEAFRAGRTARRAADGSTVIVGPWSSEVGFELLYWIPFVRRLLREGRPPDEVIVVSRGGASQWYGDLPTRYVDLFDWLSPDELMAERLKRIQKSGGEKQMSVTAFDRSVLARVRDLSDDPRARVLHPMSMYRRYRAVWMGRRNPGVVAREVDVAPIEVEPVPPEGLRAGEYIAIKAYFSSSFPDTHENRDFLRTLAERLSEHAPVILLGSGGAIDDHEHPEFSGIDGVSAAHMSGGCRENLDEQTRIVAGARMLVSTYGGFSYLGPFLGVPTCAFYSERVFNSTHLDVLRLAETRLVAARGAERRPGYMAFATDHLPLVDQIATSRTVRSLP